MSSETTIDVSNFNTWMQDPVTKALFTTLKEVRDELEFGMTHPDNILAKDCQTRLAVMLGRREALDLVLEMKCEDLVDGGNEDVQTDQTSGPQSISEAEED